MNTPDTTPAAAELVESIGRERLAAAEDLARYMHDALREWGLSPSHPLDVCEWDELRPDTRERYKYVAARVLERFEWKPFADPRAIRDAAARIEAAAGAIEGMAAGAGPAGAVRLGFSVELLTLRGLAARLRESAAADAKGGVS